MDDPELTTRTSSSPTTLALTAHHGRPSKVDSSRVCPGIVPSCALRHVTLGGVTWWLSLWSSAMVMHCLASGVDEMKEFLASHIGVGAHGRLLGYLNFGKQSPHGRWLCSLAPGGDTRPNSWHVARSS